ncbi:MAG: nonstructural protein [Microvirus sp.]|nr:MAG: nonstructural protein [Microvirus sp.]
MMQMYSIRDNKADFYGQPFYARTKADALRSFSDAINGGVEQFSKHSSDFDLFYVGDFDELTCSILPIPNIMHLGNGAEYKKSE